MKNKSKYQQGNVSILVCLAMVVLIGMTALALDAGLLYLSRTRMANALDSAVLAGAQELPKGGAEAINMAYSYARSNGLADEDVSFTVANDQKSIIGLGQRPVGLFFARVLGIASGTVAARAKATIYPLNSVKGIVPFGVADGNYSYGDAQILKFASDLQNLLPPGQFAPLALGGSGANVYRDNISNGYNNKIQIGDVLPVETGNMIGPTKQGIQDRIDACPHSPPCTISAFVDGCPRIIIVPLGYNSPDPGSNGSFTVTGFGAFLVEDTPGNGNGGDVTGYFIRYVVPGETGTGAIDRGIYVVSLAE